MLYSLVDLNIIITTFLFDIKNSIANRKRKRCRRKSNKIKTWKEEKE
nr:MAG TPA_asm: hypothetical protein [Bacteriophage sp.]